MSSAPHPPPPLIAEPLREEIFLGWFRAQRPDIVLAGGDPDSILRWLKRRRARAGRRRRGVDQSHTRDGSIAGIDQHSEEIGAAVVDHLIGRLHRNELGAPHRAMRLHVMGELLAGATLRPAV